MQHVPREGSGVLFVNSNKKNPKAPDWKGQMMIDGKIVRLSAWIKTSSHGQLLSIAVDTYNTDRLQKPKQYPEEVSPPDDNSIPF